VVLDDEDSDSRRQQENAHIEQGPDLEADRHEITARHPAEQRRLVARQNSFAFEPSDARDDIRVHENHNAEPRWAKPT
jgi:hypothetical protein